MKLTKARARVLRWFVLHTVEHPNHVSAAKIAAGEKLPDSEHRRLLQAVYVLATAGALEEIRGSFSTPDPWKKHYRVTKRGRALLAEGVLGRQNHQGTVNGRIQLAVDGP